MMSSVIEVIEALLIPWGGWGAFLILFIQEIIIVIPASVVMLAMGFLLLPVEPFSASFFLKLFFTVALPSALGGTLGSLFVYGLVFRLGKPAIDKWGKYAHLSWHDIERFNTRLSQTYVDDVLIFGLRAIPVFPNTLPTVICGLLRMPILKYLFITFFGTLVRTTILAFLGWKMGELYYEYAHVLDTFERYVIVLLGLGLLAVLVYQIRKGKRDSPTGTL